MGCARCAPDPTESMTPSGAALSVGEGLRALGPTSDSAEVGTQALQQGALGDEFVE